MTANERTCSKPGCPREHHAHGLCNTHNERRRLGLDMDEPVRQYERGERLCKARDCDNPRTTSGEYCPMHYYRPRKRLYRYGLTVEAFEQLLARQGGRCAICRTDTPSGAKGVGWCVDHDHVTGQLRGILCGSCNSGLGMLQDDPEIIAVALRYVREHRQMILFGPAVQS